MVLLRDNEKKNLLYTLPVKPSQDDVSLFLIYLPLKARKQHGPAKTNAADRLALNAFFKKNK